MAYAIAVPEILYQATQIWGDRVNVPEVMCALLASYMVLVGAVSLFMRFLARRLAMPGYGT
jgi:polar amino acid transport system permease protein